MSGCHRVAQDATKPNGKPCGVPGVAQGVPCPGPSAPSSSPTVTYNISNSYNTTNNYTTNNYSYVTNAGGAGATRSSHGEAAAAEPASPPPPPPPLRPPPRLGALCVFWPRRLVPWLVSLCFGTAPAAIWHHACGSFQTGALLPLPTRCPPPRPQSQQS